MIKNLIIAFLIILGLTTVFTFDFQLKKARKELAFCAKSKPLSSKSKEYLTNIKEYAIETKEETDNELEGKNE